MKKQGHWATRCVRRIKCEHLKKEMHLTEMRITLTKTWYYGYTKETKVFELIEDDSRLFYLTLYGNKKAIDYAGELCETFGKCIKHITPY